jgi:hypothetical protein
MPTVNYAASDFTGLTKINAVINIRASYPLGSDVGRKNAMGIAKLAQENTRFLSTRVPESISIYSLVSRKASGQYLK